MHHDQLPGTGGACHGGGSEIQWIGLLGKIETGNHRFSHEIWGVPVKMFP